MITIALASTSKFKSEILSKVHLKHICVPSTCEEISENKDPYKYVMELSLNKAKSVSLISTSDIIIGLDTIVVTNNKIIEKPKNLKEAINNIKESSNNTSLVITGITIINNITNKVVTTYQETKTTFKEISSEDIDYYIKNEPDIMYASGFIIENIASNFIDKIEGSYYNILGAPVEKIYEILKGMNISLKDINEN